MAGVEWKIDKMKFIERVESQTLKWMVVIVVAVVVGQSQTCGEVRVCCSCSRSINAIHSLSLEMDNAQLDKDEKLKEQRFQTVAATATGTGNETGTGPFGQVPFKLLSIVTLAKDK